MSPSPCPTATPITVWIDADPHDGFANMALDEALLLTTDRPVLRVYRWDRPWVSIGYFVARSETEAAFPHRPLVRRWTGGGIVDHSDDWTYSLVVPSGNLLAAMSTADSYRSIHAALISALRACGLDAEMAEAPPPGRGGLCFQSPVLADVVSGTRKIAGAAQRRTRHGLLHQGSVQGITIPASLPYGFARALGPDTPPSRFSPPPPLLARADTLARDKYATRDWLNRR